MSRLDCLANAGIYVYIQFTLSVTESLCLGDVNRFIQQQVRICAPFTTLGSDQVDFHTFSIHPHSIPAVVRLGARRRTHRHAKRTAVGTESKERMTANLS